jgi:uncharacterized protein
VRRGPASQYFALTFAWSWSFFAVAALLDGDLFSSPAVTGAWALGALGPVVAAVAVTGRRTGRSGVARLARRTVALQRIGVRWWAVILGAAIGPPAVAVALTGSASDTGPAALAIGAAGALAFGLAAGVAEEPGWRGVALDHLGPRMPLAAAAATIGAAWVAWHLPLFLIDGTFQHELGIGSAGFWWFCLQILPNAMLLAWVVVRTGGLVAAAVALHGTTNAAGEALDPTDVGRWLALAVLTVVAGVALALDRRTFARRLRARARPA